MFALGKKVNYKCYICSFLIKNNYIKKNHIKCPNCNISINLKNCKQVKDYSLNNYQMDNNLKSKEFNKEEYRLFDFEKDLSIALHNSTNKVTNTDNNCIICFDNIKTTAFIPCGHLCCCFNCADNCNLKCPICRTENKTIQKIYLI